MPSNITTSITPDSPVSLAANYQLTAADRRRIDDQIVGMQRHLAQGLLRGQTRSFFKLAADSVSLAKGDLFCVAAVEVDETDANTAVRTVTRADSIALTASGVVLGIAATPASPGATFQGITDGIVGRAITGLASGAAGAVRATSARCERVASFGGSDYAVGFVDAVGNLTLSQTAAGAAVGGGASLSNSNPVGFASAGPGVAVEAARIDHVHPRPANATTSVDGYHSATDKTNHDRMYRQGVWAPPPSGDTTGATDTAALQAAIDLARTLNVPCYLWPGTHYTNVTLLISGGATTAGGFALIGAHGYATKIVDVSGTAARVAGSAMITANDNCVLARFEDLWLVPNRVEKVFDVRLSSAQTHTNRFHRLRVFGPDYIPATSATSLDTSIASKTVTYGSVTNHFDGAPPRFDVGTKIWLGSRGSGAIMMGTITSWNGTNQFQFTPIEAWDTDGTICGPGASGSHTDWDIRFPITGFDLTGSANTELDYIFTDGLYTEVDANATYNVRVGKNVINNNRTFGPRFRAATIAQGLKIEANYEPGIFGWHFYVALGAVFNATIHPGAGDGGVRGPLIYLKDSLNVTISEGTLSKSAVGADSTSWIRAENTEGLTVRDIMVYGVTTGAEVVEVIGFALNPRIDVRRVPNAELMRNRSLATGWITTGLDGMQTQAYGTIYNFFTRYHQVDGYVPPAAGYLSLFRGDAYDPATMAWGAYSGTGFGTAQVGLHADVPHASFVSLPATTTSGFCPLGRDAGAANGLSPLFVATPSFFKFYTPGVGASKPITVVAGNHIDFGAACLKNLADPTSAQDAATKASSEAYADAYAHPDLLTVPASNVDWSTGPTKTKTIAANTTWTFTSPGAWCATLVQEIVQDGTGGRTSTLPASVVNKATIEAVLNANTVANTKCVVTYFWNKTNYVGAILAAGV